MKFRFSNPFRTIANLRAELASSRYEAANLADQLRFVRSNRDNYRQSAALLSQALQVADQALDAFMVEREVLNQVVDTHMDELGDLGAAIDAYKDERIDQARDTVTVVDYVKRVEAALGAAGITIEDTLEGPAVVVEQAKIIESIRTSIPTVPGFNLIRAAA
ncbi:hypothetical protein [Sphingomonas sp. BK580]|uniref:hypothetical protein n=1 Tax=Sphingomonas sp. BK580 TaxID=2586972 RepID=UPI00161A5346|nr:hypothetical protein [Sphingomonas sp. BK580]MBB3693043.1 chromosome segregation ATPase [Sphingomonas sp. BK580]